MSNGEGKFSFSDVADNGTVRFLLAAFMVGVAWTKLNSVETAIGNLGQQLHDYSKAQEELTVNEKLLEARVLSLETNPVKVGPKHQ